MKARCLIVFAFVFLTGMHKSQGQISPDSTGIAPQENLDSIPRPQNLIAVMEFGVTKLMYQYEGSRIGDSIQTIIQLQPNLLLLDRYTAEAQLMQNSITLNKLTSDSSYWSDIGRQLFASKIIYGIITPFNDTTNYIDLFVTDITRGKTRKAFLTYNPMLYTDSLFSQRLYQVIDALVLRDENQAEQPVLTKASDDDDLLLWIIGGAIVVGGTVTAAVLFSGGTNPSSNDLPTPPGFPLHKPSP